MASGRSDSPEYGDSPSDDGELIDAARREADAAHLPPEGRLRTRGEQLSGVWLGDELQASSAGNGLDAQRSGRKPTSGDTAKPASALALSPDSFAGYRILREIHRGGQGVVFQAIQESTRRKVALKVMREGPFATPAEQARFEREVEVLSQLNHPNIVTIHDSGRAAGCHYFVMDYISGQPLDVWIASREHSIKQTLTLFARICQAVNAAHLRGITHRDLKPSNIRVDDNGEPHILDFGLAKVATVAGSPSGAASLMTVTGQFVGSLPWASPEQAEGAPGKIDLRTDVYSLGVILYQMLTRRFPYDVIGNMRDVMDRIMQAQPVRPRTIRADVDDEVETIVLKCLAKERERRYQSAGELGRDVGHYIAGEPIEAKRDSAAYVLRKYMHKYRLPAVIAAGFVALVTVGLIGSVTFWRQAVSESRRAEQARLLADERRVAAETSEAKAMAEARRADQEAAAARQQAAIAESVSKLMHDVLARANRGAEGGNPDVRVREVLDAAAQELDRGQGGYEPEVEAAVCATIGQTYRALGLYDQAETYLRSALARRQALFGREDLGVAEVLEDLGLLLMDKGQNHIAQAQPLLEEALAVRRKLLGEDHPAVAAAMHNLGTALVTATDAEHAEPVLQQALALRRKIFGDEDLTVADTLGSLATVAMIKGEWESAEGMLREALAIRRRSLGTEHLDIAGNLNQLGDLLSYRDDLTGAESFFREALAMYRQLLGEDHPLVGMAASNLGRTVHRLGDAAGAEPLLRKALEVRGKLAREDPQLAYSARNLGLVLCDLGEYPEAETLFREALGVFDRNGYFSRDDCIARIGLADALTHLDRFAEAAAVLIDASTRLASIPYDKNAIVRVSASIPDLRQQVISLLVNLYERWEAAEPGQGHAEQADEWRLKLTEWQASTQPAATADAPAP
ncbi:MAG TPA: tetratricopeptide repeat protein [Phycisphaerae bacterium]|nr:tetratricopeptide repeat protein [Phycisphaerae bacterium]